MAAYPLRYLGKEAEQDDSNRIAPPSHRHAAPSAPWPWIDIDDEVDKKQLETKADPVPKPCDHVNCQDCWRGYPQSLFPNWTPAQVEKSGIQRAIDKYRKELTCTIYHVDVDAQGIFKDPGEIKSTDANLWQKIRQFRASDDIRVRALFLENMSGPVLQMLGTCYNVEPFFFSSSLNWIPSRYEEEVQAGMGDHITICLTFIRSLDANNTAYRMSAALPHISPSDKLGPKDQSSLVTQMIDTQAPLPLASNNHLLVLDLLSVHLIRKKTGSTIVSYHSNKNLPTTTAKYLHERIRFAGQSVYWQSIFHESPDPTFVLLTFIWHALYAWDEALEHIYAHICTLESQVITTSEMNLTQELHIIRAHLLHYTSLLNDFKKTIRFILDTKNPALDDLDSEVQKLSRRLMERECANMLSEVERLEMGRHMQDRRLKNVMGLVFSSVNIIDSRRMQKMTEAAVRDSAAMKQIAYLTMVFLPASFVAAIFGMNVQEIVPDTHGTLSHYFETAFPLTIATAWIIIAFQSRYHFPENVGFWKRLGWPFLLIARLMGLDPYSKERRRAKEDAEKDQGMSIAEAMRSVHQGLRG